MKQIVELYPADAAARKQRNRKIWTWITACAAALALAACVLLAAGTTTASAGRRELIVCVVSAVSGWVVIFLYTHFVASSRKELAHIRTVTDEPRQELTGSVTLLPGRLALPGSILVQNLQVQTGDRTQRVSINASQVRKLPKLPKTLTLYTVHGYVVAWRDAE